MPFGLLGWLMFWTYMAGVVLGVYKTAGMSYGICAMICVVLFFLYFRAIGWFNKAKKK